MYDLIHSAAAPAPLEIGFSSAVEVSERGGAATHDDNLDGTKGATPTNRASQNSNSCFFQPLRWGVDSLYLSYPGTLYADVDEKLRKLKKLAQGRDNEVLQAQYSIDDHLFEVKDKSSGLFPFTIEDGAFQIRLSAHTAKLVPMAYVKISSHYLTYKTPAEAETALRSLLSQLGDIDLPNVSRVDLFVDFASAVDMESWSRNSWVTKASGVSQYAQDSSFTGWVIGAGSVLMARLYNKPKEIEKSRKTYLLPLWSEVGWDGIQPVWRLEFQYKSEVLKQLNLKSLPAVLGNLNGLWSYSTTEWLKLTIPSDTDKTRSRWAIHPLWIAMSSIDWETTGGPLLRHYSPTRAPSIDYVGRRALSSIISLAALNGSKDFESALESIGNAAFQALADRASFAGIPESQLYTEKVALLARKYNTLTNDVVLQEPEPNPAEREYCRQTQGY